MKDEMDKPEVNFRIEGPFLIATYKLSVKRVDREMAERIVSARKRFQGDRFFLSLVIAQNPFIVTKDALDYFGSPEAVEGLIAIAVVLPTRNTFNRTVTNIIIRVRRPRLPIIIFSSEVKAKSWLLKQKPLLSYDNRSAV